MDVYTSLTDNGKISIDHSYSSNAIARFAFEKDSSYVYMCSHQISGVGATYFDSIDTSSGTVVTMTDSNYAQCLGAYSDSTDEAKFLLLMATNKYRHITIDFTGGLNNVVVLDALSSIAGAPAYDNSQKGLYAIIESEDTYNLYVYGIASQLSGHSFTRVLGYISNL